MAASFRDIAARLARQAALPPAPAPTTTAPRRPAGLLRAARRNTALWPSRDRVMGPVCAAAFALPGLRETLSRRPRPGADAALGALAVGALFDALATELEACETVDRLRALRGACRPAENVPDGTRALKSALARRGQRPQDVGQLTSDLLRRLEQDLQAEAAPRPCAGQAHPGDRRAG